MMYNIAYNNGNRKEIYMVKRKRMSPYSMILLSFFIIIIIGGTILSLPISTVDGRGTRWIDGVFTATSAVCVTGLVVNDVSKVYNVFGQTIIMIWIQLGGLGIMTFSSVIVLIVARKISYQTKKVVQEALNYTTLFDISKYIKKAVITVFLIEAIGALFLFFEFIKIYSFKKAVFYSVFHSVSAFCNAGFALFTLNLEDFKRSGIINFTIPLLIFLGGIGFASLLNIFDSVKSKKNKLSLNTKMALIISTALILLGMGFTLILERNNLGTIAHLTLKDKLWASLFQSVSTRTAGFNTIPMGALTAPTLFLYIILMFIGASPGSTGGGIKTTTFGVVILGVWATLTSREDIEIGKKRIGWDIFNRAVALMLIALIYVTFIVLMLNIIEKDKDFLSLAFETVSAFATVGLSVGITSTLTDISKWLIILTMFIGRVGPLTVAMVLSSSAIKKGIYRYPTENILVG